MLNKPFLYLLVGIAVIILVPVFWHVVVFNSNSASNDQPPADNNADHDTKHSKQDDDSDSGSTGDDNDDSDSNDKNKDASDSKDKGKKTYWGLDSANSVNDKTLQCVQDNFGTPEIWGRYLDDREGASTGLNADEVKFLHKHDIQILLIYNQINDATGYDHGVDKAKGAIKSAKNLDVPDGVAIFADIEPNFKVDSAFIQGWYETLADSDYKPGIYGVFDDSKLTEAYNAIKQKAKENTLVWTAYPQKDITAKDNTPKFKPQGPDDALLYGWQYGIESDQCSVDTNLFKKQLMDHMW
ncbi:glycoside hydrolase domain-containing protein [Lentibacillus sp. N15]|uniref:glycoside hydrolase domain-containing protein n=1 Tax=Lentibacillus songyuanensis TaxID=3136161 RepID=UPI0031BA9F02